MTVDALQTFDYLLNRHIIRFAIIKNRDAFEKHELGVDMIVKLKKKILDRHNIDVDIRHLILEEEKQNNEVPLNILYLTIPNNVNLEIFNSVISL